MKSFKQDVTKTKAWAVIDEEAGCVGVFETRSQARSQKKYASGFGWKQIIVKLTFESVVR